MNPPASAPTEADINVAPLSEDYGDISNSPGVPNTPGKSSKDNIVGAAAIAGGVAGLVACGPILGIAGAVGAGVLATQDNKGGEIARASGDVVIAAGDRAKKIDEKHHVVSKTKKAAGDLIQKGKEFDEKHHVKDKTKNAIGGIVKKGKEFEEKHQLGEKAGNGLAKGLKFVTNKLKPKDGK